MDRRSKLIHGHVNFPVESEEYISSGEGGLSVLLVAVPKDSFRPACYMPWPYVLMGESYIRDDKRPRLAFDNPKTPEDYEKELIAQEAYEAFHFPNLTDKNAEGYEKYLSKPYAASLYIGSTGWSGYSQEKQAYWYCTYGDLGETGKQLYNTIKRTYPNCKLYLQTWLDT